MVSVPSWWQAPLSDEAPEAFIIKIVNLGAERESLSLGGFLIFVWSVPHGLVVVGIHDNDNPPTIVLITSDSDLDGVLLHVGFVQIAGQTEPIVPCQACSPGSVCTLARGEANLFPAVLGP